MKEQKLFKAVSFIDEELISEAADYMPSKNIKKESGGEVVYASAVRVKSAKRQMWRYPVTAAALLAVAGGALFITKYKNEITGELKDDFALTSDESETQPEDDSASVSESEPPSEESSVSSTEFTEVEEKPDRITPIKTVELYYPYKESNGELEKMPLNRYVEYIDSRPSIPTCSLGKECFKEMSTEELFKYYGLEYMLPFLSRYDNEIIDENSPHGIYTSEDGSVYDINTFVFVGHEPEEYQALAIEGTITVTVGKNMKFGQEYYSEHHSYDDAHGIWYDEKNDTFFVVYNINGDCSVMISAKSDDIFVKIGLLDEEFREANEGVSYAVEAFANNIIVYCIYQYEDDEDGHIQYTIDHAANEYYDYETCEVYPLENLTSDEKRRLGLS